MSEGAEFCGVRMAMMPTWRADDLLGKLMSAVVQITLRERKPGIHARSNAELAPRNARQTLTNSDALFRLVQERDSC